MENGEGLVSLSTSNGKRSQEVSDSLKKEPWLAQDGDKDSYRDTNLAKHLFVKY